MIFGEAEHIRLPPMCDNEPKSIEKQPFQADSSFNALARVSNQTRTRCKAEYYGGMNYERL